MRNDLTGQKFERLTVLGFSHRDKGGRAKWSCVCDCGNERTVDGHKLTSGHSKSCGCLSAELAKERRIMDITGQTYGKLTAIKRAGKNRFGQYQWECACECGKNISPRSKMVIFEGAMYLAGHEQEHRTRSMAAIRRDKKPSSAKARKKKAK